MARRNGRPNRTILPLGAVCLCVLAAFASGPVAMAQGQSGCQIQTLTGVAFGNYNPLLSTPATANGSVTVYCQGNRSFTITLSTGQSNSYAMRYMASGTTTTHLNYNLYTDSTYTTVWGDGTGSTGTISGSLQNSSATYPIYGEIPSPQATVVPGAYTDTITLTVTY